MKKIIIASRNPVKINAVKKWFEQMLPEYDFEYVGISVSSWVSDQPMNDEETYLWAYNRVQNAHKENSDAEFYVWIEWWLIERDNNLESIAWVVIMDKNLIVSHSKAATCKLPKKITQLIHQWKELWEAADIVFGEEHSKCKNGTVWLLTHDRVTRTDYYIHPVLLALIPYKNPEIYTV